MKKNYKEKLKAYSALAGGIVLANANANDSEAQVVYHDISPDTIVNNIHPTYSLDMNNDGSVDFQIVKRNPSLYSTNFYTTGINGSRAVVTYLGSSSFDAQLSLNDTIKTSLVSPEFWSYYNLGTDVNGTKTGAWVGGETGKYLGIKFKDTNGDFHYGWVKVSLAADFSVLTILDYAYESSPGALIKVGATSSVPPVTLITAVDGGNAHNASDLSIGFSKASSETNIAHYRVFVAPAAAWVGFNLDTAQLTVAARYYDIAKTGSNIAKTLPSSLLDIYGNAIVNGTPYKIYVMSVGNAGYDDALAVSASTITLEPSVAGATAVVASDIANNGNASDMKVMFTKASSETNVSSYAVLVVPSLIASSANLTTAQTAVALGNYTTVAKTGADLSVVLSPTAKDVTGAAIAQGTSYEVFVLTIATVASNLGDSLSAASAAVTLSGATGITDAQSVSSGITAYENILSLKNMPAEGTVSVLSTSGIPVFESKIASGDNSFIINANNGIYLVKVAMQDNVVSKKVLITR